MPNQSQVTCELLILSLFLALCAKMYFKDELKESNQFCQSNKIKVPQFKAVFTL